MLGTEQDEGHVSLTDSESVEYEPEQGEDMQDEVLQFIWLDYYFAREINDVPPPIGMAQGREHLTIARSLFLGIQEHGLEARTSVGMKSLAISACLIGLSLQVLASSLRTCPMVEHIFCFGG